MSMSDSKVTSPVRTGAYESYLFHYVFICLFHLKEIVNCHQMAPLVGPNRCVPHVTILTWAISRNVSQGN